MPGMRRPWLAGTPRTTPSPHRTAARQRVRSLVIDPSCRHARPCCLHAEAPSVLRAVSQVYGSLRFIYPFACAFLGLLSVSSRRHDR